MPTAAIKAKPEGRSHRSWVWGCHTESNGECIHSYTDVKLYVYTHIYVCMYIHLRGLRRRFSWQGGCPKSRNTWAWTYDTNLKKEKEKGQAWWYSPGFCLFLLDMISLYIYIPVLELTLYTWVNLQTQRFTWLCLQRSEMKGMCHYVQFAMPVEKRL